ncbi:hypothetical protein Hanom_Chr06g00538541 [Helianthus anomalus]
MVHRHQSPVGYNTTNSPFLDDQILRSNRIEELHVWPRQKLAHDGRCEQSSVFDDHVVFLLVVLDLKLIKEVVCGFADNHGGEELSSQPCSATRAHRLLNDGYLPVVNHAYTTCKQTHNTLLIN